MTSLDIIIPTYNKPESLIEVLRALAGQHVPGSVRARIVVCDDGSNEDVAQAVYSVVLGEHWEEPVVLSLPHKGRSAARNAGIAYSKADIILFLADDIILRPDSLAAHMRFHETHTAMQDAALGWVVWDPRIAPTPFMEWMTHGGQQNNYDALLDESMCDPESFFYGSHMSIKREFLGEERFSEDFFLYGWEDLELGARLRTKGIRIFPLAEAVGLHSHWYDAESLLQRQRVIGAQKYKVNTNITRQIKHALYSISGVRALSLLIMKKLGNRLNFPRFFQWVIAGEFWYGVHHANRVLKR